MSFPIPILYLYYILRYLYTYLDLPRGVQWRSISSAGASSQVTP